MSRNKSKRLPLGPGPTGLGLFWIGGAKLSVAITTGCGKSEPEPAKAASDEAAKAAAAPEAAKEPDLGMEIDAFVAARTLEGCAKRYGEPEAEARALAVGKLAGRTHVAPMSPEALAPILARRGVPAPDAATAVAVTERGRPGLGPDELALQSTYEAAITKATEWPEIARRVEDAVATCHYTETLGLISPERVESYVQAFVEVACLGETTLDAKGKPDVIAHAQAAAAVFRKIGLDARSFSQLGVAMGTFPDVTARIADARAKACPDPRAAALHEASSGTFDGQISGGLQGTVTIEAQEGDAKASATFSTGKGKSKVTRTLPLAGVLHGGRAHLQGGEEHDWLRLDAPPGSGGKGAWSAEIGFRKLSGTWTWTRRVDPAEEAAAAAAAAAAKPAEPAQIDPAAATAGFPAPDAPAPDPLKGASGDTPASPPPTMPSIEDSSPPPVVVPGAPATFKAVAPEIKPGKPAADPGR